jgi:chromosome segregation ATPase
LSPRSYHQLTPGNMQITSTNAFSGVPPPRMVDSNQQIRLQAFPTNHPALDPNSDIPEERTQAANYLNSLRDTFRMQLNSVNDIVYLRKYAEDTIMQLVGDHLRLASELRKAKDILNRHLSNELLQTNKLNQLPVQPYPQQQFLPPAPPLTVSPQFKSNFEQTPEQQRQQQMVTQQYKTMQIVPPTQPMLQTPQLQLAQTATPVEIAINPVQEFLPQQETQTIQQPGAPQPRQTTQVTTVVEKVEYIVNEVPPSRVATNPNSSAATQQPIQSYQEVNIPPTPTFAPERLEDRVIQRQPAEPINLNLKQQGEDVNESLMRMPVEGDQQQGQEPEPGRGTVTSINSENLNMISTNFDRSETAQANSLAIDNKKLANYLVTLKDRVKALQATIANQNQIINQRNAELEDLSNHLQIVPSLEAENNNLKGVIDSFKSQLNQAAQEKKQLEERLGRTLEQASRLSPSAISKIASAPSGKDQIQDLADRLGRVEGERDRIQSEYLSVAEERNRLSKIIDQLQSRLKSADGIALRAQQLEEDNGNLMRDLTRALAGAINPEKLAELETDNKILASKLKQRSDEMDVQLSVLKRAEAESRDKDNTIAQQQGTINTLTQKKQELLGELLDSNEKLASKDKELLFEKNKAKEENKNLNFELDKMRLELAKLLGKVSENEASLARLDELEKQLKLNQQQKTAIAEELNNKNIQLNLLQNQISENQIERAKLSHLADVNKGLIARSTELEAKLIDTEAARSQLKHDIAYAKQKEEAAAEIREALNRKIKEIDDKNLQARAEAERFREESAAKDREIQALKLEIIQLGERHAGTKKEVIQQVENVKHIVQEQSQSAVKELENKLETQQKLLNQQTESITNANLKIAELENLLREKTRDVNLQIENAVIASNRQLLEKLQSDHKNQIDELLKRIQLLDSDKANLAVEVSKQNNALNMLQATANNLADEKRRAEAVVQERSQALSNITREFNDAAQENAMLKSQLNMISSQASNLQDQIKAETEREQQIIDQSNRDKGMLQEMLNQIKSRCDKQELALKDLTIQNLQLQRLVDEIPKKDEEMKIMRSDNQALVDKLAALQDQVGRVSSEVARENVEIANLQNDLSKSNINLQQNGELLQQTTSLFNDAKTQLATQQAKVITLESKNEDLLKQINASQAEVKNLEALNADLLKQKQELLSKLTSLEKEANESKKKDPLMMAAANEITKLRNDLQAANNSLVNEKTRADNAEAQQKIATQERNKLEAVLESLSRKDRQMDEGASLEIKRLISELEAMRSKNDDLQGILKLAETENINYQKELEKCMGYMPLLDQATTRIQEYQEYIPSLEGKIRVLESELQNSTQKNNSLTQALSDTTTADRSHAESSQQQTALLQSQLRDQERYFQDRMSSLQAELDQHRSLQPMMEATLQKARVVQGQTESVLSEEHKNLETVKGLLSKALGEKDAAMRRLFDIEPKLQENEQLRQNLGQAQARINNLEATLNKINAEMSSTADVNKKMESTLAHIKAIQGQTEHTLEEEHKTLEAVRKLLLAEQKEKEAVLNKLKDVEPKLTAANNEIVKLRGDLGGASARIQELEANTSNLQNQLSSSLNLNRKFETSISHIKDVQGQTESTLNEEHKTLEALQKRLGDEQRDKSALIERLKALEPKLQENEQLRQNLGQAQARINNLEATLNKINAEMSSTADVNKKMESTLAHIKAIQGQTEHTLEEEHKTLEAVRKLLLAEQKEKEAVLNKLKDVEPKLTAANNEIVKLRGDLGGASARIQELEANTSNLQNQLSSSLNLNRKFETSISHIKDVQGQTESTLNEEHKTLEALQKRLGDEQRDKSALIERLKALEPKLQENEQLRQNLGQAQARINNLEATLNKINAEMSSTADVNKKMESTLAHIKAIQGQTEHTLEEEHKTLEAVRKLLLAEQKEKEAVLNKLKDVEPKLTAANNEIVKLRGDLGGASARIQELEANTSNLQNQLSSSLNLNRKFETSISHIKDVQGQTESTLNEEHKTLEALQKRLGDEQRDKSALIERLKALEPKLQENEQLRQNLGQAQARINNLEATLNKINAEMSSTADVNKKMESTLAHIKAIQGQTEHTLEEEHKTLEAVRKLLLAEQKEKEAVLNKLKDVEPKLTAANNEIVKLRGDLGGASARIQELEANTSNLQNQLSSSLNLNRKFETSISHIKDVQGQTESTLNEEHKTLEALQKRLGDEQRDKSALIERLKALEPKLQENEQLRQNLGQAQARINNLEATLNKINAEMSSTADVNKKMESTLAHIKAIQGQTEHTLEEEHKTLEAVRKLLLAEQKEKSSYQEKYESVTKENSLIKQQNAEYIRRIDALEASLKNISFELESYRDTARKLNLEEAIIAELKTRLTLSNSSLQVAETEKKALENKLFTTLTQMTDMSNKMQVLQNKNPSAVAGQPDLITALRESESKRARLENQLESTISRMQMFEEAASELPKVQAQYDTAVEKIKLLQAEYTKLQNQSRVTFDGLKDEIDKLNNQISVLKKQLGK